MQTNIVTAAQCLWIAVVLVSATAADVEDGGAGALYGSDSGGTGVLDAGGMRSWVDPNIELKAGTLASFVVYTGDYADTGGELWIRLQVWTPGDDEDGDEFRLKWEKRVQIEQKNFKHQFTLKPSELVGVTAEDKIGFTSEQNPCPVSFKTDADNLVRFYAFGDDEFPEKDHVYEFNHIEYPAIFSYGVYITKAVARGNLTFVGNPIVTGTEMDVDGGRRSWIDTSMDLPSGLLQSVVFYASQPQGTAEQVRVQIWQPVDDETESTYSLVWQRGVSIDRGAEIYTVEIPAWESVFIEQGYKLGWTGTSAHELLYYTFDGTHKSIYYDITNGEPQLDNKYEFNIPFPYKFSIGTWVNTAYKSADEVPSKGDGHKNPGGKPVVDGSRSLAISAYAGVCWLPLLLTTACGRLFAY